MATNGDQSYAVFTYKCGELNWLLHNFNAGIGFSGGSNLYANHPLSLRHNVNDIACINQTCPPWTNVVYRISSSKQLKLLAFFLQNNSSLQSNFFAMVIEQYYVYAFMYFLI